MTPSAPATPPSQIANGGFDAGLSLWAAGAVSAPKPATVAHSGPKKTCKWDWMEGQVRSTSCDTGLAVQAQQQSRSVDPVTANLSAYRGQTVTVWFNVHLDGAVPADSSWMYLDDVVLTTGLRKPVSEGSRSSDRDCRDS